jgi:hypothetical protein
MQPLILHRAAPAEPAKFRDEETDTDCLPAQVASDAQGFTSATATRLTEVRQETTDDK